jgi:hypothetical protein
MHLVEMRPSAEGHDGTVGPKELERRQRRSEPPEGSTTACRLEFSLDLDDATADDLFLMTPIRWQATTRPPVRSVTVDVWVSSASVP